MQLNIYDGEEPAAVIVDDGHGMDRDQFLDRWLVIGTEAKATPSIMTSSDRSGLRVRQRQGQKGIGRLSSANLGPILLLVSKRKRAPFVAALVDWRLFENPFINLSDIFIPVVEFSEADQLFTHLPSLVTALSENIEGRVAISNVKNVYGKLGRHSTNSNGKARIVKFHSWCPPLKF